MMNAAHRCDFSRSVLMEEGNFDAAAIAKVLTEMKTAGHLGLDRLGVPSDRRSFRVTAQMRYIGQHHELSVPWQDAYGKAPGELSKAFHDRHEAIYGYAEAAKAWEIIDFQLACFEKGGENQLFAFNAAPGERQKTVVCGAPFGSDTVLTVPLCRPGALGQGRDLDGPALIATDYTTALIPAGARASLSKTGVIAIWEKGDGNHDSTK
jgi:N-methylhydantoinase A